MQKKYSQVNCIEVHTLPTSKPCGELLQALEKELQELNELIVTTEANSSGERQGVHTACNGELTVQKGHHNTFACKYTIIYPLMIDGLGGKYSHRNVLVVDG